MTRRAIRKLIISFVVSFLVLLVLSKNQILLVIKAKATAINQEITVAGMVSMLVNLEISQKDTKLMRVVRIPKKR